MEIWKDIKGYEGLYQISNKGRVKSLNYKRTGKEKILSPKPKSNGYIEVKLCKKGEKPKHFLVHRLVAEHFLPNPDNLPVVNHKIDDFKHRSDNRVDNLEWCTVEYNNNYGSRNEKISKKIVCVETGEIFSSSKDVINRMFNGKGHFDTISKCCLGKRKSAFGYHFKFVE